MTNMLFFIVISYCFTLYVYVTVTVITVTVICYGRYWLAFSERVKRLKFFRNFGNAYYLWVGGYPWDTSCGHYTVLNVKRLNCKGHGDRIEHATRCFRTVYVSLYNCLKRILRNTDCVTNDNDLRSFLSYTFFK